MSPDALQGYRSWLSQRSRCNCKRSQDYKWYGAKGKKVCYSSRDFVAWWLHNLKLKKWDKPTVGRIDHDGDYCFENIIMQEHSDNSKERVARLGGYIKMKPRKVYALDSNLEPFAEFKSVNYAAQFYNIDASTVYGSASREIFRGKRKFKFVEISV